MLQQRAAIPRSEADVKPLRCLTIEAALIEELPSCHDRRIDAVQLDGPDPLPRIELEHRQGLAIPLHEPARGDHLANVESRALLTAQLPERRIGDPGHRREHDRRIDGDLADAE